MLREALPYKFSIAMISIWTQLWLTTPWFSVSSAFLRGPYAICTHIISPRICSG